MRILVVDDESDICEILQYNLETEGYEVTTANSAEEALELISRSIANADGTLPDLIMLDVMMGGMSGFQMALRLKDNERTAHLPVIFITALDDENSIVKGLNIGADDYMAKPLSMKEVKARVKAVLRRTSNSHTAATADTPTETVSYESITIDTRAKSATMDGQTLQLTKLEFELLLLLIQNPRKVFTRDELLARCWPQDVMVLDRTVDVNITRLRKKIGRYGKLIKTRVGYGYCFEE